MSAVIKEQAQHATKADLQRLFAPTTEEFELSSGHVVTLRAMTVEERARMMNLEGGLDALTIMLACAVLDADGNPVFGPYKDALPLIRSLSLAPELVEVGKVIARLSGMDQSTMEDTEGN